MGGDPWKSQWKSPFHRAKLPSTIAPRNLRIARFQWVTHHDSSLAWYPPAIFHIANWQDPPCFNRFSWENPRFLWPCSIAMTVGHYQVGYKPSDPIQSPFSITIFLWLFLWFHQRHCYATCQKGSHGQISNQAPFHLAAPGARTVHVGITGT